MSGVKPGQQCGGRRLVLVGGIWKDEKELIWHSDRVGRFPFFFLFDLMGFLQLLCRL